MSLERRTILKSLTARKNSAHCFKWAAKALRWKKVSPCLMSFCLEWALKALISKEVSPHSMSHSGCNFPWWTPKKGGEPGVSIHYHHAWMYHYFLLIFIWFLSTWNHQCLGIWIRVGIRIYDYEPYLQNVIGASSEYLGSLFHHRNYMINNILSYNLWPLSWRMY